jgi:hypothetical protein
MVGLFYLFNRSLLTLNVPKSRSSASGAVKGYTKSE